LTKDRSRWLFLTAAFGSEEYQYAADRLISQAKKLNLFDKLHIATLDDLLQISPESVRNIPKNTLNSSHKFGHYFWKPVVVSAGIDGFWGDFDGVVYVDAGSEIIAGFFSQIFFSFHMRNAHKFGISMFSIRTPEIVYTKREVLDFFNLGSEHNQSNQFQSGTIFLSGNSGREICILWRDICGLCPELVFPETRIEQYRSFIAHRHEQSVISCLLKVIGVTSSKWPPGGILKSHFAQLKNMHRGIWWARNVSGETTVFKSIEYVLSKTSLSQPIIKFFKPLR
jgi:hypothetical protein